VSLENKVNAQTAIVKLYCRGYNNLILNVQWSRELIVISPLQLDVLTDPLLEPLADGDEHFAMWIVFRSVILIQYNALGHVHNASTGKCSKPAYEDTSILTIIKSFLRRRPTCTNNPFNKNQQQL